MKPDFALNFTDTSIALLHRTAKGWLKIGETPFDASDLEDALDYMRKTALGLAPGGFTTKLVIPASQILYAEVDISGGDEERTSREIANALESRTPYKADEIVWDWLRGEGRTAKVAAVARETLAEAESFAITHKFSPVGFVAIPEEGVFDGEPWFGQTSEAGNFLAAGEVVERDSAPILLIDEARAARRRAKAARQAEIEAEAGGEAESPADQPPVVAETVTETVTAPEPRPEPEPEPEPVAADPVEETPAKPAAETAVLPPEPVAEPPAPVVDPPAPAPAPAQEDLFAAPRAPAPVAPPAADFDGPAPFTAPPARAEAPAAPGPRVTITEVTPLGSASATPAAPAPVAAPTAPRITTAPVASRPAPAPAAPQTFSEADPDEAPFAHVPENTSFPETDEAPDLPPLPHLARRMAGQPPVTQPAAAPRAAAPAPQPAAPRDAAPVTRSEPLSDIDEDLPPAPSAATLAAYGRSGRSGPVPHSAPPAGGNGLPPTPAAQNGAAQRADLSAPPRNGAQARPAAAATPAQKSRNIGNLAGLITAPSIPGTRKTRALPAGTGAGGQARAAMAEGAEDAARSLGQSPFASKTQKGKPRFLGLILTAILLLCLALVAAWSSFYLSSNQTESEAQTQVAATEDTGTDVSTDDEMLADGLDPEAEADGQSAAAPEEAQPAVTETAATETAATEPAATETAPATALESESPPAVALLDAEDEIFLSSSDAPPPAFDALSLPGPDATAEAPPGAPMPPPPFGTVYRFDENGLLIPTAAGLPTPGGYMLFEGKPPRVPPARSAVAEAAAEAARAAAAAPAAPEPPAPADQAAAAGNPSLASEAAGVATSAAAAVAAPAPAAQPNPELADRRPRARPEQAQPDDDAALQPAAAPSDFASLRPRARPAVVEQASAQARAETAAASLANEAEVQLASATVAPELSAEDAANPSILTISRRPAPKPKDFSRAVEAAVAAAVRAPEPAAAAPAPVETAAAAPAPAPKGKSAAKPEEQDEIDEPEVASTAQPKIPTKASVAKQATFAKAINLSKVNLIGVYGSPSNRYALVRLSNGKYRKVGIGDKIDGGQVKAITQNEVRYQKGGRLVALAMPKG